PIHTETARAIDACRVEIEADDLAPRRAKDLRRYLPDQAQPEDGHPLAELRRRASDALQGDRTYGGGRRQRHRTRGRNAADQVSLHRDVIGMIRLARAGARDEIADRKIGDAHSDADHLAGGRITDMPSLRIE